MSPDVIIAHNSQALPHKLALLSAPQEKRVADPDEMIYRRRREARRSMNIHLLRRANLITGDPQERRTHPQRCANHVESARRGIAFPRRSN
jgi:hypothetical protein